MRRLALVAVILLLTPLASAVPEATVELKIERKLANKTKMTKEERDLLGAWIRGGMPDGGRE